MKPVKSTQSLHSSSTPLVLRQHPTNSTLSLLRPPKPILRGNFTSVYNARGRLSALREAVCMLGQQAREAEVANKLKLEIDFLREEFLQRRLTDLEGQLGARVKELRKRVVISKRSDLLKYESIQNIFDSLAKGQKELTGKVQLIEQRVEHLENIMGGGEELRRRLGR